MTFLKLGATAALSLAALGCGGGSAGGGAQPAAPANAFVAPPVDSTLMIRTGTGLQYRDIRVGTGHVVTDGQFVAVHYIGQLLNGTEFDANRPGQEPLRFQIGSRRVIRGWEEGVAGMRVGGRRQMIIPPHLAYGQRGVGPIPPNATLVFLVEVVDSN